MQNKIKLVLVSFLALFLELILIRWFPSHLFSIAFFSNVVLIASFLGLGVGFLFCHEKRDFFSYFAYALAGSILLVLFLKDLKVQLPENAQTWIWNYYGGNRISNVPFLKVTITQLIAFIFALTTAIFIPVGQKIGKLMKGLDPLYGYTLNVFGSLLGVIGFAALSAIHTPAWVWFFVAGSIVIYLSYKDRNAVIKALVVVSAVFCIWVTEHDITWSPYYAINTKVSPDKSISVYVNQLFHQKAVNFEKEPHLYNKYMLPYSWFHPKRVLIIGAGTGNDVWIAGKSGAERIDAVEIDPSILKLGHPLNPYDSDRVKVFVDDARSFMHRSRDKYDMIVYGTLDSHATLSVTSSIRLDNYIYTQEALQEARRLLKPDGVVVLLFSVPADWMFPRLVETVRSAFGCEDVRYMVLDNYLFNFIIAAGPGVKQACSSNPEIAKILLPIPPQWQVPIPTDDWPYLYLIKRGIPYLYRVTLMTLIFISLGSIFIFSPLRKGKIKPLFFFLGSGFLLLETKSVTTFSLLFGSTWIINAIVFSSILAIALFANRIVMLKRLKEPKWLLGGLMLSLVFVYFFPISTLLNLAFFTKILAAGALIALPIFFSSFVFAIVIERTKDIGIALGSNLLGAVIGGFLEYSSMAWGLNALYIVALACYITAAYYLLNKKYRNAF